MAILRRQIWGYCVNPILKRTDLNDIHLVNHLLIFFLRSAFLFSQLFFVLFDSVSVQPMVFVKLIWFHPSKEKRPVSHAPCHSKTDLEAFLFFPHPNLPMYLYLSYDVETARAVCSFQFLSWPWKLPRAQQI